MTEVVVPVIIAALASTGFWEFLQFILACVKKKRGSLEQEALLALLHNELYYALSSYNNADHITPNDYDNLEHMYKAYRALGGNGTIQKMFEQLSGTPIKD